MRVLLSGYYGFGNLGDEAILAGLAGALKQRGHEPVVLSSDPDATTATHEVEARHRTRGLLGALASVDAVVSGGGGLLQDKTSTRSLSYYLWVIRLARLLGRRTAVYGQSLGPLTAGGRARLARDLRGVPLFLRDRPSLELAAELRLEATLVGDAALLLAAPPSRAETSAHDISRAPDATAAPNNSAGPDAFAAPDATAAPQASGRLSDAAPIVLVPRGGYDPYNAALERLAAALTAEGRDVAVLAFHPVEDLAPAERVLAAAPGSRSWQAPSVDSALSQLAGAAYVVSARLHGCILAAVAGVGFAGLSYDPKVAGFLEQAAAPCFEAPVDAGALLATALAARPHDAVAVGRLRAAAHAGIDSLLEALR